ncbi:CRPV-357 [Crowpox virus]|nr:CRPV-357 [Crowpox virus]
MKNKYFIEDLSRSYITMLFNAIKNCDSQKVIDLIRSSNIDVNIIEENLRLSPLHYAVECGNKDIVISILEHGADVNLHVGDIQTPIDIAVNACNLDMVKLLVENGADIDTCIDCEYHYTPLQNAINNNSYEITEFLLLSGADTDENYTSLYPLMFAIRNGNKEIVKLLLEYNASTDKIEYGEGYPINLAIRYGNIEIVDELLRHGANPNSSYRYSSCLKIPLHQAVYYHRVEIVKLLILYGADVDSKDSNGNTPMHLAVNEVQEDIIRTLLDSWANVTIINESLSTCLLGCYTTATFPISIKEMLISRTVLYKYINEDISINGLLFNWLIIESDEYSDQYKTECEKEISRMISYKIGSKCLFDVCFGKVNYKHLIRYLMNNEYCINEYKIYKKMLEKNILIAKERNTLIQDSLSKIDNLIDNKVLPVNNRWSALPVELKHMILCYLSNDDLKLIVDSK